MKRIVFTLLMIFVLILGLAVQVGATDGAVPEEEIVYKQDVLYVYWDVEEELYCQVQYGVDYAYEVLPMTPVEGKSHVWVIENLPDEITSIMPIHYEDDCPIGFPGSWISDLDDGDNMYLAYSDQWCTYDPDAVYEETAPEEEPAPSEDVPGEDAEPGEDTAPEEDRVPEENIVYKQDKLYVYIYPGYSILGAPYCQIQYGADNSYETIPMTPVEGNENVWVTEDLPDEITNIGLIEYRDDCPVLMGEFDITNIGENDNMCMIYSSGEKEWCIYGPDIQYVDRGTCGEHATYTLMDGLLIIEGEGAIDEWAFTSRQDIVTVQFGNSINEIGDFAFYECVNLKEVALTDSIISIGEGAFFGCSSLEEVVIPDSVTTLNGGDPLGTSGLGAFGNCTNLKSVTIGKGVELIPWGFLTSENLETLILPENITQIDGYGLTSNPKLTYVEILGDLECAEDFAFQSDLSLTNLVFRGDAPKNAGYIMGICGNYITAAFYPKDNPTWENVYIGTAAMIPYTLDGNGNIIPEAPEKSEVLAAMERFRSGKYFNNVRDLSAGKPYPNNYRYIINGNFIEGTGSEAFAFELSDACFGFLPISDHRDVVYADLQVGDLLYMGDQVWVIAEISDSGVKVHGAENEVIVYDKSLTKAQVESADSYRTRYGVSPGPGETNPFLDQEKITVPEGVPTEAEAYQRIIALKEDYPEGMPWNEKNYYLLNVEATWTEDVWCDGEFFDDVPTTIARDGSACSAFGYLASDTAFGDLPATYYTYDKADYDNIMVGDNLVGFGHEVVVLEAYKDCLVVVEGNYNGIIHWGRILPREEVEGYYDVLTRYPEGTVAPERENYGVSKDPVETLPPVAEPEESIPVDTPFTDIGEEKEEKPYYFTPVTWAVSKGITTGTSETTFAPESECTRGQIVTFIWRAKGEPEPQSTVNPFKDVKATDYFYKAVLWAVENGITNGLSATEFGPGKGCTRGQVCTFLWRAQGQPAPQNTSSPFTDVTGEYYYNAVLWAVENGITNGMGGGKFAPNSTCTRGQIVTFLYRAIA